MRTMIEVHTVFLGKGIYLTTRRTESSNGIPVLVVDGIAYPRTGVTERGPAADIVRQWAAGRERSSAERALAALFFVERCSSWSRRPLFTRLINAGP